MLTAPTPQDTAAEGGAPTLARPTQDDIPSLAQMRARAFSDKACCCQSVSSAADENARVYREYAQRFPRKLEHCCVVRTPGGAVLGAIQLAFPEDPGDLSMPSAMRHKVRHGECYVEWVALDEAARGSLDLKAARGTTFQRPRCPFRAAAGQMQDPPQDAAAHELQEAVPPPPVRYLQRANSHDAPQPKGSRTRSAVLESLRFRSQQQIDAAEQAHLKALERHTQAEEIWRKHQRQAEVKGASLGPGAHRPAAHGPVVINVASPSFRARAGAVRGLSALAEVEPDAGARDDNPEAQSLRSEDPHTPSSHGPLVATVSSLSAPHVAPGLLASKKSWIGAAADADMLAPLSIEDPQREFARSLLSPVSLSVRSSRVAAHDSRESLLSQAVYPMRTSSGATLIDAHGTLGRVGPAKDASRRSVGFRATNGSESGDVVGALDAGAPRRRARPPGPRALATVKSGVPMREHETPIPPRESSEGRRSSAGLTQTAPARPSPRRSDSASQLLRDAGDGALKIMEQVKELRREDVQKKGERRKSMQYPTSHAGDAGGSSASASPITHTDVAVAPPAPTGTSRKGAFVTLRARQRVYMSDVAGLHNLWNEALFSCGMQGDVLRSDLIRLTETFEPSKLGMSHPASGRILEELCKNLRKPRDGAATTSLTTVTFRDMVEAAWPNARPPEVTEIIHMARDAQRVPEWMAPFEYHAVASMFRAIDEVEGRGHISAKQFESFLSAVGEVVHGRKATNRTLLRRRIDRLIQNNKTWGGVLDVDGVVEWWRTVNPKEEQPLSAEIAAALGQPGSPMMKRVIEVMEKASPWRQH
ncbi:unnamed protein product [Pedinophyceae sp. YPF-701]|nr:unnamed protein product [Pedinophyceae sp. YPF-701]